MNNKLQRHNVQKMLEHLYIAKSYCELAWCCGSNISSNALSAEMEPYMIQELIDSAEYQLSLIGVSWTSIECSVIKDAEF